MKARLLITAAFIAAGLLPAGATPTDGEVVAATGMDCSDYFAVKTDDGYVLLEWYGGYHPEKGDKVSGEFAKFGYQDIVVQPRGVTIRAYVADYGLSLDDANDKLKDKCN